MWKASRIPMWALAAAATLGTALAQPPNIFPWWEGQIATELNLTDAQRQQVESIQREYRTKMIDGRADLSKAELELEDLMNADPFDLRRATEAAGKAAKARDEMTRSLTQMSLRLRAVLTKQQWQTARGRFRRPEGIGGPRGGGGFDGSAFGRRGGGPPGRSRNPEGPSGTQF
jgi:Spy/CpxP family protein refolding chaperone